MMKPPIDKSVDPSFREMEPLKFQRLCRELFAKEPNISTCEVYGDPGEGQDGIDLLAYRSNGDGTEVGQCKRYKKFAPADIREASDEFFKYWESHWSKIDVRRFILFTGCDLSSRQRQDEITKQKERFKAFGIVYEAWSAADIRRKLQPRPEIVRDFLDFPEFWVQVICGTTLEVFSPPAVPQLQPSSALLALASNQIDKYAARESGEIEKTLDSMRERWREGQKITAVDWLRELKNDDTVWVILPPNVKAKVLRFEASLELDSGNVNRAKELTDEARNLAPNDNEAKIRALIEYKEQGPEAAAQLLANQEDVDSLNLKAAYLLESGRVDECSETLDRIDTDREANPEAYRLRSLVFLAHKDIRQAQLAIMKASEIKPNWVSVQFVSAVIDYSSGISSAALPNGLVEWPEPEDWTMVKRDDESQKHRQKAAEVFRRLAEGSDEASERRKSYQTWCLACLANDPDRQDGATDYCRSVLHADPTHYRAIIWAMARNLGVDWGTSEKALEELVAEGLAKVIDTIALACCRIASGRMKDALELLENSEEVFDSQRAGELWKLWCAQLQVQNGNTEAALATTSTSPLTPELRRVRLMALRAQAKDSSGEKSAIQEIETNFAQDSDPESMFVCCELMAHFGKWAFVYDRAGALVEKVGTPDALRLAAIATFNCEHYAEALKLLDDNLSLFAQRKLPSQLRRLRVQSQVELGIMPAAVAEAEELARDEPTIDNLLGLARLYVGTGDLRGLAVLARRLENHPGLNVRDALWLADSLQYEDKQSAIAFFELAIGRGLADEDVGPAMTLGFSLGLDKELGPLYERMAKLAAEGRGGVRTATFEEHVSFLTQRRDTAQRFADAYRNGQIPVHLFAEDGNWALVEVYQRLLDDNEKMPDPYRQAPLFVRHGGHPLMSGFPDKAPTWRLNLDLTALLLAAHLDILDKTERAFKPLRIPIKTLPALLQMLDKVTPLQPLSIESRQKVIELAEKGMIEAVDSEFPLGYQNERLVEERGEEWVALYETARASSGYLVDFLPLMKKGRTGPVSVLPEEADKVLVNCHAVVDALRRYGPLSPEEHNVAIGSLGTEGAVPSSKAIPREKAPLYLDWGIAVILANTNLLPTICQRFKVRMTRRELQGMRSAVEEEERKDETASWLSSLIERLRKGLADGVYEMIPRPPNSRSEEEKPIAPGYDFLCLEALLRSKTVSGDVMWSDDRCLNGYLNQEGGMPIVGVSEVMKALVAAGVLSPADYYGKIVRLRAGNARFIPIQEDEILHQIGQAVVENGKVIETAALDILRRYVAACLLQGDILQRPPQPKGIRNGEVWFIESLERSVVASLVKLWRSEEADDILWARAEWILTNLYLDRPGSASAANVVETNLITPYEAAIGLADVISQSFVSFPFLERSNALSRKRFLDWMFLRLLRERFVAEPALKGALAELLKKTYLKVRDEGLQQFPSSSVVPFLRLLYGELPEPLRDEMEFDADFRAGLGLETVAVVSVGDLMFDADQFTLAAGEAINGRTACVTPIGFNIEVTFLPVEDAGHQAAFRFTHPMNGETVTVRNGFLELLAEFAAEREAALRRRQPGFDCSVEEFEHLVAEILATEDPRKRVETAESRWKTSAFVFYSDLLQRFRAGEEIPLSESMPPNSVNLLRHFRLPPDPVELALPFQQMFATAAESLVKETELQTAVTRLVAFPVPLPKALLDTVASQRADVRGSLVGYLTRLAKSPLSEIHVVGILMRLAQDEPSYESQARSLVDHLMSEEGAREFAAFKAILQWTDDEFGHRREFQGWQSRTRLAMVWAHAHMLYTVLKAAGQPDESLIDLFKGMPTRIGTETFVREPDYWLDIANPHMVNWVTFLLTGLSYGLGENAKLLVDEKLKNDFTALALVEANGLRLPSLPLQKDSTRASNSLGSFLGGDRGETLLPLLGADDAAIVAHSNLEYLADIAVSQLASSQTEVTYWTLLGDILGGLPLYEGIVDRVKDTIRKTDFASLSRGNKDDGLTILRIASRLIENLDDEDLRSRLKSQLADVSRLLSVQSFDEDQTSNSSVRSLSPSQRAYLDLVESALNISLAGRSAGENAVTEFSDTLAQITEAWPAMFPTCKTLLMSLVRVLPISEARHFWRLLVRCRTERAF